MNAQQIVAKLGLEPHPEGGYFRETYRASATLYTPSGERSLMTAILFLVVHKRPSRLHRLVSDELWVHQAGDVLEVALLDERRAAGERVLLGPPAAGAQPQVLVPAGTWQGARLAPGDGGAPAAVGTAAVYGPSPATEGSAVGWGLVCCVVSHGFDFEDFEMGDRDRLLADFPGAAGLIREYTL